MISCLNWSLHACLVEVVLNLRADEKLLLLALHELQACRAAAVRACVQNDQSDQQVTRNKLRARALNYLSQENHTCWQRSRT
jgi:hypothetical protein